MRPVRILIPLLATQILRLADTVAAQPATCLWPLGRLRTTLDAPAFTAALAADRLLNDADATPRP